MAEVDSTVYHILAALQAGVAEVEGNEDLADRLHAQTRLRLMAMSDEELWKLARLTASPPERPVELVYEGIKQAIKEHEATASEWLRDLSGILPSPDGEEHGRAWEVPLEILCVFIGCAFVYCSLFSIGSFIYGAILRGLILGGIAAASAFFLFSVWGKLHTHKSEEK